MKLSASIELVWQMAGREAIASEHAEIEPEHFVEALLQFAEMPVEEVERGVLVADRKSLREGLAARGIDGTRFRRALRGSMGKGDAPFGGGTKHRSAPARAAFESASRLARGESEHDPCVMPRHLLKAILSAPTPALKKALGGAPDDAALELSGIAQMHGMFTKRAQALVDLAKDYALSAGKTELNVLSLVIAVGAGRRAGVLMAEALRQHAEKFIAACPKSPRPPGHAGNLPLGEDVRSSLAVARDLANEIPDPRNPRLIDLPHLICGLASSRQAAAMFGAIPISREDAIKTLADCYKGHAQAARPKELIITARPLREHLLGKVFGQDHAVEAFAEGLFSSDNPAAGDVRGEEPRGIFVFAGPPGAGKHYLAELGAAFLQRPFRRFNIGEAWSAVADFVRMNPHAVLFFDDTMIFPRETRELSSANLKDATIIVATKAGANVYDRPNENGVTAANSVFHRRMILEALKNERDPITGEPFLPATRCSWLATSNPVLFNRLGLEELTRVACAEMASVAESLEGEYSGGISFDDVLPLCVVLREGSGADARTVKAQAGSFIKSGLLKVCQLLQADRLSDIVDRDGEIQFMADEDALREIPEIREMLRRSEKPRMLIIADDDLACLYGEYLTDIDWRSAQSAEGAVKLLEAEEMDTVLVDLAMERAWEILGAVRRRFPDMSAYLLSLGPEQDSIGEDLLDSCLRAGGARGVVFSEFIDGMVKGWRTQKDRLGAELRKICDQHYLRRRVEGLGQVLAFDTAASLNHEGTRAVVRVHNFRLAPAPAPSESRL